MTLPSCLATNLLATISRMIEIEIKKQKLNEQQKKVDRALDYLER